MDDTQPPGAHSFIMSEMPADDTHYNSVHHQDCLVPLVTLQFELHAMLCSFLMQRQMRTFTRMRITSILTIRDRCPNLNIVVDAISA